MPAGNPTSQSCLDTIAPDPVGCTQVLTMPGSLRVQGAMASTLATQAAHDTEGTPLSPAAKSRGPWRVYAGTTLDSAGGLRLWGQACPEPATPLADPAIPLDPRTPVPRAFLPGAEGKHSQGSDWPRHMAWDRVSEGGRGKQTESWALALPSCHGSARRNTQERSGGSEGTSVKFGGRHCVQFVSLVAPLNVQA